MELSVVSGDINIFDCDANSIITMDNGNIFINGLKGNLLSNTTLGETLVSNYEGESSVFNINVGNLKINKSKSNINATIDIGSVNINNIQGATTIFTGKGLSLIHI